MREFTAKMVKGLASKSGLTVDDVGLELELNGINHY